MSQTKDPNAPAKADPGGLPEPAVIAGMAGGSRSEDESRKRYEGQLYKFTNVVKGWQYRWFVLDPESGRLEYYLPEEMDTGKCRGAQYLSGAMVNPSEEDSNTFTINFASGDIYKLRSANAKERQVWVDRVRGVVQMHEKAIAASNPPLTMSTSVKHLPPTPPGSRSHISNGEPSVALQNLSLSALDAFGSAHDILHQAEIKHVSLSGAIELLPHDKEAEIRCLDEDLLVLKATSNAALASMEEALGILQDVREVSAAADRASNPVMTTSHISKSILPVSSPKKPASFFAPSAGSPSKSVAKSTLNSSVMSTSTTSLPAAATAGSTSSAGSTASGTAERDETIS